ncbi:GNAT family N-acetyltransferase [Phormidium sp. FACHB-592]|uniref:GNAT family N-acetyltransferase n=1 Tax=Stenomitos frigidus AS-A4 TaxID=2933935 RepID=A0ABV0KS01_9CYAN|nr:GNAT family N-acetyltransferase [Phormidium sp. FACHB-592]MBD2074601.1 GNAT family N-acetyltransferase [Phormidium sp. FACHB-592]
MIRLTAPDDMTALLAVASAAIEFQPDELEEIGKMLVGYLNSNGDSNSLRDGKADRFWVTDDDDTDGPVGVAYCEPERMTDQAWNLQLIAIHPNYQGQGRGGKLLSYVEETLKARGGRMLLVETLASLERTQAFYARCGYEEEACIRDFYAAGYDKVVFRKVLNAA